MFQVQLILAYAPLVMIALTNVAVHHSYLGTGWLNELGRWI